MKKKEITKFPKGFFQLKRPTITASKALKDVIPIKWEKEDNNKQIKDTKVKLSNNLKI